MAIIVEAVERMDAALAPIIRHANAHEFAPPLRLGVQDCQRIKERIHA